MTTLPGTGAVVIGRNEGDRLERCLRSVRRLDCVVYVDSGSTDDSVQLARSLDIEVVVLDPSQPFTAARARNAGHARLVEIAPDVSYVQFVDGDCELLPEWLPTACRALEERPRVAIVAGRLQELRPDETPFNRLCQMEWNAPAGQADSVGGIFLIRAAAFAEVGGFDPRIIAGEEPELCQRLRQGSWTVLRLDTAMATHDADIRRFSQWWRRQVRAGHSYAENYHLHNDRDDRRALLSNLLYSCSFVIALALAYPTFGASLLLLGLHVRLYQRVKAFRIRAGDPLEHASLYARYTTLGKLPQTLGMLRFYARRLAGRKPRIIEYKTP